MQILIEDFDNTKVCESEVKKDEKLGKTFYYLKGTFIQGEIQNHNGRIYPRVEIEKAIQQMNQKIKESGPVCGELDHPEGLNINFERIAVAITEMRMNGNDGVGTMRVIPGGMGKILEAALEAGVHVGVSRRGSGDVDGRGRVRDFDIVTIDAVINPRAPGARPAMSISEAVHSNKYAREALSLTQYLHDDPTAQKFLRNEVNKFLVSIRDEVMWRNR